ncbi:MAG TPA: cytochrome c [Candidatus Binataceae bacterium]|nr:cytochrome c [Candidatus Binataceae bacterium]
MRRAVWMMVSALLLLVAAGLASIAIPALVPPARAQSAQALYTLNCWGCHSSRAQGIPGTVPRLAHSMGCFPRIPEGRAYLVQVPGVANSPLDDGETAIVLNWMLLTFSRAELPMDFRPYTAAEVKRYRAHRLASVIDTRRALGEKLAARRCAIAAMNR